MLNQKKFIAKSNSKNGEVGINTIFHYRQKEQIIWATYEGGSILFGTLSGRFEGTDELRFTYQHQNLAGEFLTGKCNTKIRREGNRVVLNETWEWTCRDFSKGTSTLIEIDMEVIDTF